MNPSFLDLFNEINAKHFESALVPPVFKWNSRLRSSAGRFIPGSRKWLKIKPPVIEVAAYLKEETRALELIKDTIAHEMIHYWLWSKKKPYGHTPEFYAKMNKMGASRYNPVPRLRPYKYMYRCMGCKKDFPTKKKLGILACLECCKTHAQGKFDIRFKLEFVRTI